MSGSGVDLVQSALPCWLLEDAFVARVEEVPVFGPRRAVNHDGHITVAGNVRQSTGGCVNCVSHAQLAA